MKNGDARFAARHLRATFLPCRAPFAAPVKRPLKKWRNKTVPIIKAPVRMRGAFCVAEEFIYGRVQPSANKAARA